MPDPHGLMVHSDRLLRSVGDCASLPLRNALPGRNGPRGLPGMAYGLRA